MNETKHCRWAVLSLVRAAAIVARIRRQEDQVEPGPTKAAPGTMSGTVSDECAEGENHARRFFLKPQSPLGTSSRITWLLTAQGRARAPPCTELTCSRVGSQRGG